MLYKVFYKTLLDTRILDYGELCHMFGESKVKYQILWDIRDDGVHENEFYHVTEE
jgi:hypothetical protein